MLCELRALRNGRIITRTPFAFHASAVSLFFVLSARAHSFQSCPSLRNERTAILVAARLLQWDFYVSDHFVFRRRWMRAARAFETGRVRHAAATSASRYLCWTLFLVDFVRPKLAMKEGKRSRRRPFLSYLKSGRQRSTANDSGGSGGTRARSTRPTKERAHFVFCWSH